TSTAIDSFIWTPTDQFFQCVGTECQMAKITPLSNVTYVLTVIDSDGCTNSDEITIDVDKRRNIFIPNAFAPEGVNQEFRPYAGAGVLRINSMNIFDRWGKLLYNVEDIAPNDQTTAWDGRYNGKHVNTGVYVYLIEVTFLDGITLLYRGDVTVIR
ncbi:MAG: gliding motility-associated C-terminal domain-containing protein, partial [Bacteroidota bacterium]